MFSDFLSTLAAAGSATTISRARIAIADAAASGKLSQAAAEALEAVSRVAAEHIAAHGERPAAAPAKAAAKPAHDRHHATIRTCRRTEFSDSGIQLRGNLEVVGHGIIQFRVKADGSRQHEAFLAAVGATAQDEPGDMLSRVAMVECQNWTNAGGEQRLIVTKWWPVDAKPKAAPAAQHHAQEQTPKAPRRGTAAKARAAWEHDDEIPF